MSEQTSDVLGTIEALMNARPFTAEGLGRALGPVGATLEADPERSNPHFTMYRSAHRPEATWAEVELRAPTAAGRDGLVLLTLGEHVAIPQREVMERFGSRPELAVPTPRQPPTAPIYLVYRFSWGEISFGFPRDGRDLLRSVVLDATEARP